MELVCAFVVPRQLFSQNSVEANNAYFVQSNLPFSNDDSQLALDLYVPNNLSKPVPCILVIQGGGFRSQTGERFKPYAKYIAEHGFVAVLFPYRGLPDHTFTTTLSDVKSAVRYVRSVSSKYNINPDKIGAMGRSAGATLAVLAAVTGREDDLSESDKIQAVVGYAGVYDFIARFSDSTQISMQPNLNTKMESNGKWIGSPFSKSNIDWQKASAINYVDKNTPPILLLHCKNDSTVPWIQSETLHNKMLTKGAMSKVIYYETGGHGFKIKNEEEHKKEMVGFFREVFGAG